MAPSQDKVTERRRKGGTGLNDLFIGVFGVGFVVSLSLNVLHMTGTIEHSHNTALQDSMADFKQQRPRAGTDVSPVQVSPDDSHHDDEHALPLELYLGGKDNDKDKDSITYGELNCDAYHGGPSKELAQEMVYWQDIPSDSRWVSPFQHPNEIKFLTFEPDGGGWNNIRMAMESVIGLAVAMGRTLVMPPAKKMYLLGNGHNKQQKHFSFVDFYPIEEMAEEHVGLDVITMKEYLETQALTGKLRDKVSKEASTRSRG
jgi:hypothetical protein